MYELRYELDNRPDWVGIPVAGIQRLIERAGRAAVIDLGPDPHSVLGAHEADDGGVVVRAYRPEAQSVRVQPAGDRGRARGPERAVGGAAAEGDAAARVRARDRVRERDTFTLRDPYAFLPTLGELDLHLVGEGRHEELYERLGAHVRELDGVAGTAFAVWAPNARSVSVVGDFNSWDGRAAPDALARLGGIWELFVPGVGEGATLQVRGPDAGRRAAPQGRPVRVRSRGAAGELRPSCYRSTLRVDATTSGSRRAAASTPLREPMSIYEVHLGSWRRNTLEGNRSLTYLELADELGRLRAAISASRTSS